MWGLNTQQQEVLEHILNGEDLFVTGGAGVGKTVLLKEAASKLREMHKTVVICAPTGIAAFNAGGTTIHRLLNLKFGVTLTSLDTDDIKPIQHATKVLQLADVILLDEVSMVRVDLMDSFLASVRKAEKARSKHIQICVFGDFYQLPPVLDRNSEEFRYLAKYYGENIGIPYAFKAKEWRRRKFKVYELTEIVRQSNIEFISCLNRVRVGNAVAVKWINDNSSKTEFKKSPYFFATNEQVDTRNKMRLDFLDGEAVTIKAFPIGKLGNHVMAEIGEGELVLKEGARVIATRNNPTLGIYNGMLGTIMGFSYMLSYETLVKFNCAIVKFDALDNPVVVQPMATEYVVYEDEDNRLVEKMSGYYQLPLRLAYALTIHKSQGLTCDNANVDTDCKFPGQLYVVLSRVRNIEGLHLMSPVKEDAVISSEDVKEFIEHANDSDYNFSWEPPKRVPLPRGRKSKSPQGTKVMRVPIELTDLVENLITKLTKEGKIDSDLYYKIACLLLGVSDKS